MNHIFKKLSTYKWMLLAIVGLIFIQALSELLLPTLMGTIVDDGIVVGNVPYIWKIGAIMLVVTGITVLFAILTSYLSSKVAMGLGKDIRRDIFKHVSNFSLKEFDKLGTASLITRSTNDVTQIQQAAIMMLRLVVMAPIMLIGGIIMAISKDAKLSLVILTTIPILIIAIAIVLKFGMPMFKAVQRRLDRLNLVMRENLTGVRVIRAFNKEKDENKLLKEANENLTDVSIKVNKLMAFAMPVMMLVMNLTIVAVIWFGGIRIDNGNMHIGDLMAFIQYVMLILFALVMASMMFIIIPRASVSANRIKTVLDTKPTLHDKGEISLTDAPKELTFNDVTFYYPGADGAALENISFTAKRGETTAIIGGTGSGKSTLINLIPRFYDVTKGAITINDTPLTDIALDELRSFIGLVPQQAQLFSGTIKENLLQGKKDASLEEIKKACEIAQAKDFIEELPEQYEEIIEQGGANFSGGQKQRLSIARALVRKPCIYLFDDSFSALDYRTDAKLRQALKEETEEAIVFIVAQRVSTVIDADQIIVLDEGKMSGIGTHDELLETNTVYQEIVASQLGEGEIA